MQYFLRFVENYLCYFFSKAGFKRSLTQGNCLKTTLLNEKQTNHEKCMYGNISLYCQYFSPEAGSNVHKKKLLLFNTNEKVFYLLR